MATSMEKSEIVKSSDTYDDVSNPCQPCSFHGKVISSDRFCIDCQEYMCSSCTMHHSALKATRNHKLVAVDEAEKSPPAAEKDKCSMKCTVHKNKTVKYFCKSHSYLGCSVCFMMDHKQCNDVEHIPTVAENVKHCDDFNKFDEKLKAVEAACKTGISDVKKTMKVIEADFGQLKDAMQQFRKQVIGALDTLENELMEKAGSIMCEEKMKLDDLFKKLSKHQAVANAMIKQADTLLSGGKYCDTYVLLKIEAKTLMSLNDELNGTLKGNTFPRYEFHPNPDTMKTIASSSLSYRREGSNSAGSVTNLPLDGAAMAKLLKPGTRVRRGKNWQWGNQDQCGLGTITGHCAYMTGCYNVKWDNGKEYSGYRVDASCCGLHVA